MASMVVGKGIKIFLGDQDLLEYTCTPMIFVSVKIKTSKNRCFILCICRHACTKIDGFGMRSLGNVHFNAISFDKKRSSKNVKVD